MPSFSVLTNTSAMNALFQLNKTQSALDVNQGRINTGLKIGSAKDDAATFTIATGMRSDVAGFKKVRENMALGLSTLSTASSAIEKINDELVTMKEKVIQASNLETGREDIQIAIDRSLENIRGFASSATFNGINLIDGVRAQAGETFETVSSLTRGPDGALALGKTSVAYQDLSVEEADRGLGMIKEVNVVAGKATETKISRDDPTGVVIDLSAVDGSASAVGEKFSLKFVDAEGAEQTLTFTVTSSDADAAADNFMISTGGATGASTTNGSLRQSLAGLLQDGGALSGLGFSVANLAGTTATVELQRESVGGQGQLVAFSIDDTNLELTEAAANLVEKEATGGAVQIELEFNATLRNGEERATQVEAGDTIDVTFNDGTNNHVFTFVVGADNEFAAANDGQLIAGTANRFQLAYESAVTKNTGDAVTVDELASTIATLLSDTATVGSIGEAINGTANLGYTPGTPGTDFNVTSNNGKVTITDLNQEAATATHEDQVVSFNMASSTGGSLDFDYLLDQVNAAEAHLNSVAAQIGATQSALESQDTFMESLVNAVEDGIGTLVDANMAEESAKFQALQVQQQLGLQALSIANSQPQSILSLFR